MREPERLDVEFKTSMSKSDNCICNACHGGGTVMKLTYPITKFHDRKHLSTKYNEFWLCAKCRTKLVHALDWPDDTYREAVSFNDESDMLKDTLNNTLRLVSQAKELYLIHNEYDFDTDWAMDQFGEAETVLERIRDIVK